MLALLVLALAAAPTPAPSPGVLQEIGRVRSRAPLCTTLREAVAPSILALLRSDTVLAAGHQTFVTMGKHELDRSRTQLEFDRIQLGREIVAIVGNLKTVDALLDDTKRFPKVPATDDERRALAIKEQLQAVARAQNNALNVISGTLETDKLGQMQHEFPSKINAATATDTAGNRPGTSTTDPDLGPVSYLDSAGVQRSPNTTQPAPGTQTGKNVNAPALSGFGAPTDLLSLTGNGRSMGRTLYDAMAADLNAQRIPVDNLERTASQTIVDAAQRCTAEPAQIMPLPATAPSAAP